MDNHYGGGGISELEALPSGGRLHQSLQRTETGSTTDLRSPLLSDLSYESTIDLLSTWPERIPSELGTIDDKEIGNFGARSIMKPFKDRAPDVSQYWGPYSFNASGTEFNAAVESIASLLDGVSALSLEESFGGMPHDPNTPNLSLIHI